MLSLEESLRILRKTNALIEGHFILSSGLHSSKYVQCAQLMSNPNYASQICESLASKIKSKFDNFNLILSPAMGGIIVGYEIGKNYLNFPVPEDSLFLSPDVYQWRFDDEVSICAYWAGHYNHSLELCQKVLASPFLSEGERERVKGNLKFAEDAISP